MAPYLGRLPHAMPDVPAQLLTALIFTLKMVSVGTINDMVTATSCQPTAEVTLEAFSMNTEICFYSGHPTFENIFGTIGNQP